jgi:hypothetical protein
MGLLPQQDWPLAALSWLGEGNDPAGFYWLRADPVHLVLQRDHFSLSEPVPLAVAPQDAQTLVESLNQHFAADGLQFLIGDSGHWYLRLETSPGIVTSLPEAAVNRDIRLFMPKGAGAAKWNGLLNEIQMLLFEHPVNQAREARGELAVNSIWFSAGGVLPKALESAAKTIYTNRPLARGLARIANFPCFDLPDIVPALSNAEGGIVLVPDTTEDADGRWVAPLLQSLRDQRINRLSINLALHDQLIQVTVRPADLWKFWRKSKSLEAYFNG